MKRRTFVGLLGLAGLGAWPAGCWRPPIPPALPGRIVGASFAVGHRLRGGAPLPSPGDTEDVDVAIVGGGIAGLSAAWKLRRSGFDRFRLFELESETGGNARYAEYPVSKAPWGAHYLPVPTAESKAVREFLQDAGVMRIGADGKPDYPEEYLCFAPEERLFLLGRWQEGLFPRLSSKTDLEELRAFERHIESWKTWRDPQGRKPFTIPLEASSRDPDVLKLDRLSMADYMRQCGWLSDHLHWYVEYACRDDYGSQLDNTSAWAGMHYYASRDGGGFRDPNAVLVWPEGNGFLVRKLREAAGDRLTTNRLVYDVHAEDGTIDMWDPTTGQSHRVRARRIIYAAPRFTARYVLDAYRNAPPAWLSAFAYAPWVVANVVVNRPPPDQPEQMPLCWDNVFYDSPSLGYVVATHQSLRTAPGPTVLTWYRCFPETDAAAAREAILARSWESWRDEVLSDLERAHPGIRADVQRLDVMLWGHAMIRPHPGFVWGPERAQAQLPVGCVHFAHSDMSGISIFEEAQYHGIKAAEQVMTALHHPYRTSL